MASVTERRRRRAADAKRHASLDRVEARADQRDADADARGRGAVSFAEIAGYLLATAAVFFAVGGGTIAAVGPAEKWETRLWVIAIVIGLPFGHLLARRQERSGALVPLGVAATAVALTAGILIRRAGDGSTAYNATLALAGLVAAAAPFATARAVPMDRAKLQGWTAVTVLALLVSALPFLPPAIHTGRVLAVALPLAAVACALVRYAPPLPRAGGRAASVALRALFCVFVFLLTFRTSTLEHAQEFGAAYSQNFFLGPVNAVMHGRPALVETWSQYGIGQLDGLRALFWIFPFGYGGLQLMEATLTGLLYIMFFTVVTAATRRPWLAAAATLVAIARQVFNVRYGSYLDYPSTGPLRFGAPYLLIGAAVLAARVPARARWARAAGLVVIALAAPWSFEAITYTMGAAVAIAVAEGLATDTRRVRRIALGIGAAVGAAAAGIALYTLAVAVFAGTPDWGPYIQYIRLYFDGFGTLPVVFFGQGPLMGTLTICSAAALVWVLVARRIAIPPPARVAIAGFTGFALASYTYYLGRSVDNNLVHLLPPVVAYLAVWTSVLLGSAESRERLTRGALATTAVLLLAAALTVGAAWHEIREGWGSTALAQVLPAGGGAGSLGHNVRYWWHDPVNDPDVPDGEALLAKYWRPHQPALVLAGYDRTTELLMRTGRLNVLPLGHPSEDDLIRDSFAPAEKVIDAIAPGTYLLVRDGFQGLSQLQAETLNRLAARYTLATVETRGHMRVLRTVDP